MPNRLRKIREVLEKGKCSICMDYIKGDKGLLICHHDQFCLQCLINWSAVSNKCPLCMGKFFSITNPATKESVAVEDKTIIEEIEYIEDTICEVCELGNNEDMLLLCDNCDLGFHTNCVGMARIPYLDYWYCSVCIKGQSDHVQFIQRREIMNAREPELPQKRSRRTCRIVVEEQKKPRRSERLRN